MPVAAERDLKPPGRMKVPAMLAVVMAAAAAAAAGQVPQFSSRVQLVEVYATVTDGEGTPVTGLRQQDFVVSEDGEPQDVATFAAGEFPLTVALGVDRSWSMAGEPLRLAKSAAGAFLRALRPADRTMILAISSEADIIAPLSQDRAPQLRALAALDPWSTTALHDGIIAALERLAPEPGRQALVLFSDGSDRYSAASAADVLAQARRSNALIYPIGLGKTRPALMTELAVVTGARSFQLRDARELERTLSTIARELRSQYLLGYTPRRPIETAEAEWRSIRVTLRRPQAGVRVRARDGYATR